MEKTMNVSMSTAVAYYLDLHSEVCLTTISHFTPTVFASETKLLLKNGNTPPQFQTT